MSPYTVTASDVVTTLGITDERKQILRGWLSHRGALRGIGFVRGFQWLDGSFVEDKKPRDLDVLTFLYRPQGIQDINGLTQLLIANLNLFDRTQVKATYHLDFFPIDLNGCTETIVDLTRYYLGLFSHRRGDDLWKGMLQVRLEDINDDISALAALGPNSVSIGGTNP